jgi:hypothetical protein
MTPTTCEEWSVLKKRGFSPENTLERQADSGALIRCGGLEFLTHAAPSRVSYMKDVLERVNTGILPAILATATSEEAVRARATAASQGMSLAQLTPDAKPGKAQLPGQLQIAEPASGTSITVNAQAWGDINADGVEDLLLSVLNTADSGSYFETRLLRVTRTAPHAPLSLIAESLPTSARPVVLRRREAEAFPPKTDWQKELDALPQSVLVGTDVTPLAGFLSSVTTIPSSGVFQCEQGGATARARLAAGPKGKTLTRELAEPGTTAQTKRYDGLRSHSDGFRLSGKDVEVLGIGQSILVLEKSSGVDTIPDSLWIQYARDLQDSSK